MVSKQQLVLSTAQGTLRRLHPQGKGTGASGVRRKTSEDAPWKPKAYLREKKKQFQTKKWERNRDTIVLDSKVDCIVK